MQICFLIIFDLDLYGNEQFIRFCKLFLILWYDYSGENHTPLMSNGMAAIPKNGNANIELNWKLNG